MKLTAILLTAACLQVAARTTGQTVTLDLKDAPVQQVFREVSRQTGISIVYAESLFKDMKPVTIRVKDATVQDVLGQCLKGQPFTFSLNGSSILISSTPTAALRPADNTPLNEPPPIDVHGKVVNEKGEPVAGASIKVKGSDKGTSTNDNGEFTLTGVDGNATLVISGVNIETFEVKVDNRNDLARLSAKIKVATQENIQVLSTGYQKIPKERATGAFGIINSEQIDRRVTTNIMDRINNMTPGLYFLPIVSPTANVFSYSPASRNTGITVRGISTINSLVGTEPLIVLDNFPYNGDLANINPNDIESVTVLKDAAAASIWGARAGNGVIVLTTKKGRLNSPMQVDFNANLSIISKPNIYKDVRYLNSNDFINVEESLFQKGYFDDDIANTFSYPALSPVVTILAKARAGQISQTDATAQINALRGIDVRDDFYKYTLQKGINQQYSVGLRGGTNNMSYNLNVGYDDVRSSYIRNSNRRITINALNTYKPIKNLEITTGIYYANNEIFSNAIGFPGPALGSKYAGIYPYARLIDASGNPAVVSVGYSQAFKDSVTKLGFLDWSYRPLQELQNNNNTSKTNDYNIRVGASYKILNWLTGELQYQNESQGIVQQQIYNQQTYFARDLINNFLVYTPGGHIDYVVPLGGILNQNNISWKSYNWRGQLNGQKAINPDNVINGIIGAEVRQFKTLASTQIMYGYDEATGSAAFNLNYTDYFPTNTGAYRNIPYYPGFSGITERYVSYYSNIGYTYKDRYTLTASARKDGANIFGVKTNDKWKPLWSIGGAWTASKEQFYNLKFLPYLSLRATYGFNGNVYSGSAYTTGLSGSSSLNSAPVIVSLTPPNPRLSWENVENVNIGADFSLKNEVLSGTIDAYQKRGKDLIEPISLPASSGFTSFNGNAAEVKTTGLELTLKSKIINKAFKWNVTLIGNFLKDKTIRYDAPITPSTLVQGNLILPVKGKSLSGIYSYRWAGLDPQTGDPRGYYNKQVSTNYAGIIANATTPDSLVYSGSARPTRWGNWQNQFYYKGFSLYIMITYKGGYYFRRTSSVPDYADAINTAINTDYTRRWQKPGDELHTNVPSFTDFPDNNRNAFYQYSEALVEKADHIRLQEIRLAYDLTKSVKSPFKALQLYTYASNLGILWKANKANIDPDAYNGYPFPLQLSFGIKATF